MYKNGFYLYVCYQENFKSFVAIDEKVNSINENI